MKPAYLQLWPEVITSHELVMRAQLIRDAHYYTRKFDYVAKMPVVDPMPYLRTEYDGSEGKIINRGKKST